MVTPWRRIYTVLGLQKQTRDSPSATSKLELKTMAPALVAALFVAVSSLAGGFREYAKTDEVKIIRQELSVTGGRTQTREIVLPINYKAIAQGQNLHQNFALKPGDVIVVP
jgi:protein involved in polysaccharide export with SLBB domain